jgi:hypothetical protein
MAIEYKTFKVRPSLVGGEAAEPDKLVDEKIKQLRKKGWHVRGIWSVPLGPPFYVYITCWKG